VRLTLPHEDIVAALADIGQAKPGQMKTKYSVRQSERVIEGNWLARKGFRCDVACLAGIAALSSATCGQPVAVEMLLRLAMVRRQEADPASDDGLLMVDVESVVGALYTVAGAVGSVWPETKAHKDIGKRGGARKAYAKTKAQEKEIAAGVARDEELGEDAAAAANPRGLMGGEVDELAGRLGRASVPDNVMLESDSEEEEDPVRVPGRLR